MNCVRPSKKYEDHLTYPMVIGHRIREVEGRLINSWANDAPRMMSTGEYNQLMTRLDELETEVARLQNGRTHQD